MKRVVASVFLAACGGTSPAPARHEPAVTNATPAEPAADAAPPREPTYRPSACGLYRNKVDEYAACAGADDATIKVHRMNVSYLDSKLVHTEDRVEAGQMSSSEETTAHIETENRCIEGMKQLSARWPEGC